MCFAKFAFGEDTPTEQGISQQGEIPPSRSSQAPSKKDSNAKQHVADSNQHQDSVKKDEADSSRSASGIDDRRVNNFEQYILERDAHKAPIDPHEDRVDAAREWAFGKSKTTK